MLNSTASRAAKEAGMQFALDFAGDEWRERVLEELRAWCAMRRAAGHTEMQMEQFRAEAKHQPPRPQAWGALASVAIKAGIIAPLTRGDGSAVYRAAESVKTHGHPVRVYSLAGTRTASQHDAEAPQAQRRSIGVDGRGAVLHGGDAAALLAATADYHAGRAAMGGQG